jgi:hypothetical protein
MIDFISYPLSPVEERVRLRGEYILLHSLI